MVKAIIFDIDGTLIDSVDAHADSWTRALSQFGYSVDFAEVRHQIGKKGDQLLREFLSPGEFDRDSEKIKAERQKLFKKEHLPDLVGFPRVRELVEKLMEEDIQIALASSATEEEVEAYKEIAGIADLVGLSTSGGDADLSKPEPDMLIEAFRQFEEVDRADVAVVGDSPWDARAAQKGKFIAVGVLCGGFDEDELREAGCKHIFDDPKDILDNFERFTGLGSED